VASSREERPRARAGRSLVSEAWAGMVALVVTLACAGCSVGHGDGEVGGIVSVAGCRREGPYELTPTAFFAQAAEQVLKIRVQRGSDIEVVSDGLAVLVEDASLVKNSLLGQDIAVATPIGGPRGPRIDLTLYLNESCPAERDKTPVVLSAVSGTVRFHRIYAPEVKKGEVRIDAELSNVRFEDPRTEDRWALLEGYFDFLYVRGRPAQRFP